MIHIPLTHYLNRPDSLPLKPGDKLYYQNTRHPANSPKHLVTFRRWNNTGIGIDEFTGSHYTGNFWVDMDESSGKILIPTNSSDNPNLTSLNQS